MTTPEDSAFDLDLVFLPAWAQQPANKTIYAPHEGERESRDEGRRERRDYGDRPPRRDQGGPRPGGPRPGGPRSPGGDRRPGRGPQAERGRRFEPQRGPRPEPAPLPEVDVQFRPEEQGVDSLARQIKMTGRAYPLFAIAQLVLEKPERHHVVFSTKKKPDGSVAQALFACALDDTVWLSENEAVAYVLDKHFAMFYQAERTQTTPPKGTYTFVAQCGMSGAILGPPNYHDYQNQLRKLHADRFSRMPFETFKARVKIVRDEAVVKKWIEDQSWKIEYSCLNVPEPGKLATREDVEKHFRQTHLASIIKQVDSHRTSGTTSRSMPCRPLQHLVRVKWEDQNRFPLQLATTLSQLFATRGLQFFKVNKAVTHVAVARPHYLDLETNPVSENIRRIVEFVNAHPKCTRRQLFEALAPSALPTVQPPPESTQPVELTPEASAIITDLHWLVHQGHVIEFANGTLETAKKPIIRPPKPQPVAAAAAAAPSTAETPAQTATEAPAESSPTVIAETTAASLSETGPALSAAEEPKAATPPTHELAPAPPAAEMEAPANSPAASAASNAPAATASEG